MFFLHFRWVEHIHAPHEYLVRQVFPGIRLDQFGDVEELFNVNLWVYELVEEERVARPKCIRQVEDHANEFLDLEAGEVDGESDDETSSELSDETAVEIDEQHLKRRQKIQTALLVRKPPKESQEKQDRLNVYLNRYGLLKFLFYHLSSQHFLLIFVPYFLALDVTWHITWLALLRSNFYFQVPRSYFPGYRSRAVWSVIQMFVWKGVQAVARFGSPFRKVYRY